MRYLSSFPRLNTIMILIFFWMWLYTEVQENRTAAEWKAFVRTGARFTAEDGANLDARITELEECSNVVSQ